MPPAGKGCAGRMRCAGEETAGHGPSPSSPRPNSALLEPLVPIQPPDPQGSPEPHGQLWGWGVLGAAAWLQPEPFPHGRAACRQGRGSEGQGAPQ